MFRASTGFGSPQVKVWALGVITVFSYPVHKQMLTINTVKGDPGECFEYFLRLF